MRIFLSFSVCAVAGLVWPRGGGRRLRRLCHSCHGSAGVVATRALRLHGAHRGGSPWRNDSDWKTYWLDGILTHLFASIYIDVYTPTLVKPIHTHIYIHAYLNIFSYPCILYLHICHGQVPWPSRMFPIVPVMVKKWTIKTIREILFGWL